MKIEVTVRPGASRQEILHLKGNQFKIYVQERATEGRANEAVREALADYFGLARSRVRLVRGVKSRLKLFEVEN